MKKTLALLLAGVAACGAMFTGCASQETYTPQAKEATLTTPAIGTEGVLKVGVDTSQGKAPLAGTSAGSIVGIDPDLAVWLADELGLSVQVIDVSGNAAGALAQGTVDIVLGLSADESLDGVWLSDVYIPTAVVLFALDSSAAVPADDSNPQISAEAAKVSAWAVANEYGADALVSAESMGEVFEMLRDGSVQYAAADALIGLYAAKTVDCDASIIALMQRSTGYCVGVRESNTTLQEAITSAMNKLKTNGILEEMVEGKWLGKAIDLSDVPYTPLAEQTNGELVLGEDTADDENAEGEGSAEAEGEGESAEAAA